MNEGCIIPFRLDERGTSLSEQVYLGLRESIVRGELSPGYRLLVLEVASALGVSQAPVREAMERLKQEGLLVGKANKGSIVAEIKQEEIEELYALRELIEWDAVRRTIPRLESADYERLNAIYEGMVKAAHEDDLFRFIDRDMEFHEFFYVKSGNRTILQLWRQIAHKLNRFLAVTNKLYFPDLLSIAVGHEPLIEVLRTGDEEEIRRLYVLHLREVWGRMDRSKQTEERLTGRKER
ncbi:GntR family transcriptional regulator [Cohnella hongkongensis]|uniref:GntR family transcriptional regulator n=1 Tax=Cohnella hongkongensis TaxID=178337 RepID=A0ABV9F684_9BACL